MPPNPNKEAVDTGCGCAFLVLLVGSGRLIEAVGWWVFLAIVGVLILACLLIDWLKQQKRDGWPVLQTWERWFWWAVPRAFAWCFIMAVIVAWGENSEAFVTLSVWAAVFGTLWFHWGRDQD